MGLAVVGVLLTACGTTATPTAAADPESVSPSASVSAATPTIEKHTVTETEEIPFETERVDDPTLDEGTTKVRRRGVEGVRTFTYQISFTDGVETGRRLVRKVVTREPVDRVIAVGTKETSRCDPNYSGACVPIASDVDCAGGSGNGPAYVDGPVRIVGTDVYDLDRDGDGIACDD
ncbi:G5 domain-containing protein [Thermomonospora umbrina]|nr:G5 domain-containing protein [Thermomonospora umbrina]